MLVATGGGQRLDDRGERRVVGEQRGDVLERHARLREVGHVDRQALQRLRAVRRSGIVARVGSGLLQRLVDLGDRGAGDVDRVPGAISRRTRSSASEITVP